MNRGGLAERTPNKTALKDGGLVSEQSRATKSGRKVKRPAHFDDSPNSKTAAPDSGVKVASREDVGTPKGKEVPISAKKSARKTILKSFDEGTPSKNGVQEPEAVQVKSARKTLLKEDLEQPKKSSRRTIVKSQDVTTPTKEASPEPEIAKKSARKTLLKSAVKNTSVQEHEQNTPKKNEATTGSHSAKKSSKKVEAEEIVSTEAGISRTGRKIKVPAHLKEFEEVVVASPKKELPVKSVSRKSMAPVRSTEPEGEENIAPKTPRGRSLAAVRKGSVADLEDEKDSKTPSRRARTPSRFKTETDGPTDASPRSPSCSPTAERIAVLKTRMRGKSVEPATELVKPKFPAKPFKRGELVVAVDMHDSPEHVKEAMVAAKAQALENSRFGKSVDLEGEAGDEKLPSKTPKRGKATLSDKPAELEASREERIPPKTPRRGKSVPRETDKSTDSDLNTSPEATKEDKVPIRTARRGKSLAPETVTSSPQIQAKLPTKTPTKRGKSMLPQTRDHSPDVGPNTPKAARVTDESVEPMSRSGRKIKPKKFFGEFEKDETVLVALKPASPIKPVVSPQKKVSPVKRHSSQEATVKSGVSPPKKTKLEQLAAKISPKVSKISPNTEERQITKRGINDHHHRQKEVVVVLEKDPLASIGEDAPPLAKPEQEVDEVGNLEEKKEKEPIISVPEVVVQEKPKRGRKTLPAPAVEEDVAPKAPKTPSRRTMAVATSAPPAGLQEDTGSSRSGRKIKPKKFFDDEANSSVKSAITSAATAGGGGRGRRKTVAVVPDDDNSVKQGEDEKKQPESHQDDVVQREPMNPSRSEILAVVGAVEPAGENEEKEEEEKEPEQGEHESMDEEKEEQAEPIDGKGRNSADEEEEAVAPAVPESGGDSLSANGNDGGVDDDNISGSHFTEETDQDDENPPQEIADPEQPDLSGEEESQQTENGQDEEENADFESEGNFPETRIAQTAPPPQPTEEVPNDPVPLAEANQSLGDEEDVEKVAEVDGEIMELGEDDDSKPEPTVDTLRCEQVQQAEEENVVPEEEPELIDDIAGEQEGLSIINTEQDDEFSPDAEASEEIQAVQLTDDATQEEVAEEFGTGLEPEFTSDAPNDENDIQIISEESAPVSEEQENPEVLEEILNEQSEVNEPSACSSFSDALLVEDDLLLESALVDDQTQAPIQEMVTAPEEEQEDLDNLDKTEPPELDDIDDVKENELLEDVPEPTGDVSFADRDDESITVLPDTQKVQAIADETFEVSERDPTTPKTPESKITKTDETFSPNKPDDGEKQHANVPQEIIEIPDSPIVTMLLPEEVEDEPNSATSTPFGSQEHLIQNSRKRSLSAGEVDIVKKNVTFHSPANSTMLVDTIDERLKKSFKNESVNMPDKINRQRSQSEHRELESKVSTAADTMKPFKVSKMPNFKNIHQQQFKRMESIEEFQKRKVQRAKDILTNSAAKSPAAAMSRSALQPKSLHRSEKTATSSTTSLPSSASKVTTAKPLTPVSNPHKPLTDVERMEKRQKQYQTAFKSKTAAVAGASSGRDNTDGTRHIIEQSRHKQGQILRGVRTNKRFELLMKFRDSQD